MSQTYVLICDSNACKKCYHCETLVAGFRKVYDGCLFISETNIQREEVRQAVDSLVSGCPHKAITFGGR